MLSKLLGLFSSDMAIDLGTANTLVYVKGRGNLIPYYFGHEAKLMLGRTPAEIEAKRSLKDGVLANGIGSDTDTLIASAMAYVNALNRLPNKQEKIVPEKAAL